MYYSINVDENGNIINPDLSSVEGWEMESDLAVELITAGYALEEDDTFIGPNGQRVIIVEK